MDRTVHVAKYSQEEHELHVSLLQYAQPRRGIPKMQSI